MLDNDSLEFCNSFDIGENGLITNPGKFESECRHTPYYWNLMLNGAQDDTVIIDDITVDIFNVSDEERKEFPDLVRTKVVALFSDSQGFCYTMPDPDLG